MYVNRSGKALRLPINKRATALWWLLDPENAPQNTIVGDIVLVGTLGRNFAGDIPTSFVDLVMRAKRFKVVVAVTAEANNWLEIPETFDDYFEAALCAVKLAAMLSKPARVIAN